MRNRLFCLLFIMFSAYYLWSSSAPDTLIVLHTTDIHGNLFPYDYIRDMPVEQGLIKISSRVNFYREKYDNVILLDGGDMFQGTVFTDYYNRNDFESPHPLVAAMNYLGYDAFTVGNHEIEQGLDFCKSLMAVSEFPWLSANGELEDGTPFFQPYTLIRTKDMTVGILGLTTPGIPKWVETEKYPGIIWKDMVETADHYFHEIDTLSDIQIGLFHSGFDAEREIQVYRALNLPPDNSSALVGEKVSGFEVILGGHSHRLFINDQDVLTDPDQVLMVNSGSRGIKLGVVEIVYEQTPDSLMIISRRAWHENVSDLESDRYLYELFRKEQQEVIDFAGQRVGEIEVRLSTVNSRKQDTELMEFINDFQLDLTGADIAFCSCFDTGLSIGPGAILYRDIMALYPYDNYLYVIELSGKEIREYLEYSSGYYLTNTDSLVINPDFAGYNFDLAEGISYKMDLSSEIGDRIDEIRLRNGEEIENDRSYKVAMNSFRALGGGGHLQAIGALPAPILFRSDSTIQQLLIDHFRERPINKVDNNWKIIY